MKKFIAISIALVVLTAAGICFVPPAHTAMDRETDKAFDGFRQAMEDFTDVIMAGNWKIIEGKVRAINKRAEEIRGLEIVDQNKMLIFHADWLVMHSAEMLNLARKKDSAELIWDYGSLNTRYQWILSHLPDVINHQFAEAIIGVQEAAENKNAKEASEGAEIIDESGMQLILAASMMKEQFANTRWVMELRMFLPIEPAVISAVRDGKWDTVMKIVSDAEKLRKKIAFSQKKGGGMKH